MGGRHFPRCAGSRQPRIALAASIARRECRQATAASRRRAAKRGKCFHGDSQESCAESSTLAGRPRPIRASRLLPLRQENRGQQSHQHLVRSAHKPPHLPPHNPCAKRLTLKLASFRQITSYFSTPARNSLSSSTAFSR